MAALTALTKRVTIGPLVTPLPLRHAGIVARMAAMLDLISSGRFILGVGAGWYKREFLAYSIPWNAFSVRIMKMKEGIDIIRRLWTRRKVSYDGKFYKLRSVPFGPKPIQRPHPPIWIGGASESILKVTAEYGDGWIPRMISPEDYARKLSLIQETTKKLGRDFNQIETACVVPACISNNKDVLRNFEDNFSTYAAGGDLNADADKTLIRMSKELML